MMKPWNSQESSLFNLQPYRKINCFDKKIAWLQCWSMISLFRMTELDCT